LTFRVLTTGSSEYLMSDCLKMMKTKDHWEGITCITCEGKALWKMEKCDTPKRTCVKLMSRKLPPHNSWTRGIDNHYQAKTS
jgi:hypothetical protein